MDGIGQVYKTDSTSKANFVNAKGGYDVIIQNGQVIAFEGVYSFYNVLITAMPGSSITTKIVISGMQTFGQPLAFV